MSQEKPVPSDVEAEEAILGSILIDPENALPAVAQVLEAADFYREKNGWIYAACLAIQERGQAVNALALAEQLRRQDRFEVVGGVAYVSRLIADCPTSVHAADYAELVRRCSLNRRLISASARIARIAWENPDPAEALGKAQEELLAVGGLLGGGQLRSLGEILRAHHADLEQWVDEKAKPSGTPTGFPDLDATVGGFERGRFYVLAARTSMGKSQCALWLSMNVARQGKGVAVFSTEMSELNVSLRLILGKAKINRYAVRVGDEAAGWEERFWKAHTELAQLPIWLDDTSAITTSAARSRLAQLKAREPRVELLVFDYAGLAGDDPDREETARVSNVSRRLQAMAKSLDVAVLGVYQLNRGVESRNEKRPTLSDLRQSGVIEECADVVLMLYRPSYYKRNLAADQQKLLEVLIRKNRDGATGEVPLFCDVKTGFIGSWEERREELPF